MYPRSVHRDTKAMGLGIEQVEREIKNLERVPKKAKSVKNRLERLYEARKHLINSPKDAKSLVDQLKEINT